MKKVLILLGALVLISLTNSVEACSVGPDWTSNPQDHFDTSDVVFVGTVTNFEHVGDINGTFIITFDVDKEYKGGVAEEVKITTGSNSAMCGYDTPFEVGDVWSIYATKDLTTTSITANTKYSSFDEAILELDSVLDVNPVVCPLNYDPVCGRKDTGIRCITIPCDSTEDITYGNTCALEADGAEFIYKGVCKVEVEPVQIPDNCKVWFDGCNQCFRGGEGGPLACTEMACFEESEPTCREYFPTNIPPVVDEPVIEEPEFEYPETNIPNTKGFWQQFVDFITKILNFNF